MRLVIAGDAGDPCGKEPLKHNTLAINAVSIISQVKDNLMAKWRINAST